VIPSAEGIIEGWGFVARRLGRNGVVNRSAVEAVITEARDLARTEADEPAALFYAFARHPRAFLGGWRVMPRLLAGMHCRRVGLRLKAGADELDQLRARIVVDRVPFAEVNRWFREHTERPTSTTEP
jgi:hypothetical protein